MMYQADESRYDKMSYKRCGNSGILLPRVSLGMWQNFGAEKPLPDVRELFVKFRVDGGEHIDAAFRDEPQADAPVSAFF